MRFGATALATIFILISPNHAWAESKDETTALQGIYACAAIPNDTERLACFDSAVPKVKQAETTGAIIAINSQSIQQLKQEAFGFELPSLLKFRVPPLPKIGLPKIAKRSQILPILEAGSPDANTVLEQKDSGEITKVGFIIERYKQRPNGKYRFYLANGQVWEQTNPANVRIPRNTDRLIAEIRRAAMGSFLMQINGKGRAIRVRRSR